RAGRLGARRRPALADVELNVHVFRTRYTAVDEDLPSLIARHRPDVLLMFGLAARTRDVRIEMRARNAVSALAPDAGGRISQSHRIRAGQPAARPGRPRAVPKIGQLRASDAGPGAAVARCRLLPVQLSLLARLRGDGRPRPRSRRGVRPCPAGVPRGTPARPAACENARRSRPR